MTNVFYNGEPLTVFYYSEHQLSRRGIFLFWQNFAFAHSVELYVYYSYIAVIAWSVAGRSNCRITGASFKDDPPNLSAQLPSSSAKLNDVHRTNDKMDPSPLDPYRTLNTITSQHPIYCPLAFKQIVIYEEVYDWKVIPNVCHLLQIKTVLKTLTVKL